MNDEAAQLRATIADVILVAVLHPADQRYEIVSRAALDKARMMIGHDDITAAAERARSSNPPRNE